MAKICHAQDGLWDITCPGCKKTYWGYVKDDVLQWKKKNGSACPTCKTKL